MYTSSVDFFKKGIKTGSILLLLNTSVIAETGTSSREDKSPHHFNEITVTAQKTEQRPEDVGITLNSFSEREIDELKFYKPVDVGRQIPNVQVINTVLPFFTIRGMGVNEFAPNTDSPVAVHVDEVYLSRAFQVNSALFDLAQVDVLKGPQGTLFGRNTTGGSVNFTTAKPTETFQSQLQGSYGRFNRKQIEGYFSGPIHQDLLGRFSGFTRQSSGGPSFNQFTQEELGAFDEFGVRGQLQWFPSDENELLLTMFAGADNSEHTVQYGVRGTYDASVYPGTLRRCPAYFTSSFSENSPGCLLPSGQQGQENDPFTVNQNRVTQLDDHYYGSTARYSQSFRGIEFTSISAYQFYERDMHEDDDGSPQIAVEIDWYDRLHEYTQEFRLNSDRNGRWKWLVGAYFQHDDLDVVNVLDTAAHPLPAFNGLTFATSYEQTTDTIAFFNHNEFVLREAWSLIAGVRFTWERNQFDGITQIQPAASPTLGDENRLSNPIAVIAARDDSQETTNVSFKLGLNYQPNTNQLYYSSLSTGFKSGGFNGGFAFSTVEFSEFQPEEIIALEIGTKQTLLKNTLQVNASAFYYDVSDTQISADGPTPPNLITTNAESSRHMGAELEANWRPITGLDMRLGIGWLDAEYGNFFVAGINQDGNEVVNSPEWTVNGLLRYEIPVSSDFKLITLSDFNFRTERHLESTNVLTAIEPSVFIINSRLALSTKDEKFEIALWGRNLTDEVYRHYVNDVSGLGFVLDLYEEPVTYGIDLTYRFQ